MADLTSSETGSFERIQRGIEDAYANEAEQGWYSFVSLADVEELLAEHKALLAVMDRTSVADLTLEQLEAREIMQMADSFSAQWVQADPEAARKFAILGSRLEGLLALLSKPSERDTLLRGYRILAAQHPNDSDHQANLIAFAGHPNPDPAALPEQSEEEAQPEMCKHGRPIYAWMCPKCRAEADAD